MQPADPLFQGGPPALVADCGGTSVKAGLVGNGTVLARASLSVGGEVLLADLLPRLSDDWRRLAGDCGLAPAACRAIGIGFPTLIDPESGRITAHFGKYPDSLELDLSGWAREEFGLPLFIDNDARCAVLGEWRFGAGRGVEDLTMMTLGTGIGCAAVVGGRLLRGHAGNATILSGHSTLHSGGPRCPCGNIGCAENEASTRALPELIARSPGHRESPLRKLASPGYDDVFSHAAAGDTLALELREHSLDVWASLAGNLVRAYDPARLILGGGVMRAAEVVLPAIRNRLDSHLPDPVSRRLELLAAELGDDAGLLGASLLIPNR